MIYNKPIAVACNYLSLLRNSLTPTYWGRDWGGYLRGFFNFLTVIVPHTIEMNLNGLLGRKHKGYVNHPVCPLPDCVRGTGWNW